MKAKRIIAAGSILILILVSLCIYYNSNYESHLQYPSNGAIISHYPEGSVVSVSGEIVGLNSDGFNLQEIYNGKQVIYKIKTSAQAEPGDSAQVIGILGPSYTIKSTDIIVTPKWSYEFVLLRSVFGLIFLIFIFFKYWEFDLKLFEFIRRK